MIYKQFRDEKLSGLGMGNMRLPVQEDQPDTPIDRKKAQEIIDYAMENGINYYDTAYVYHKGESEKFLGEALRAYPRDSYYLATKYSLSATTDYKALFEEQLERLHTDHIDFYLMHAVSDNKYRKYMDLGCVEYFQEQKERGRIRYLGFSSHASLENLITFADYHNWDFAQLQINYFDWNYGNAQKEYQVLEDRKIPIMVMEPVRGGRLAGLTPEAEELLKEAHPQWSIASWALRFANSLPQVRVVLSGMSTLEQMKDNAATFAKEEAFTEADQELLMKACELFRSQVHVPCTQCRYCCDDCPMGIAIPEYLKVYNSYKTDGRGALNKLKRVVSKGQPADCVGCGRCMEHCPQNINVPEIMKELSKEAP